MAILAHPDHSLRAFRNLSPTPEAWMIGEDVEAPPPQAYRRALRKVEMRAGRNAFVASHGGATLLEYDPRNFIDDGIRIPDLEVAGLTTSTDDGHPLLTLGLRSPPETREADRQASTFVFAVDDSFVVRSIHFEFPAQKLVSDCRFEYDHPGGQPVLRSYVTTIQGQARTIRLNVEECRFGPIPEAEFALESFLAGLQPGEIVRKRVVNPAKLLEWYWLAFVVGGISLAGGSGMALRIRDRDRRAPRAD